MFAPVIGAAYTMTTKREAHWSEQTKAQNTEKRMYVGLKQPRGDGERYVTPARAAAKETTVVPQKCRTRQCRLALWVVRVWLCLIGVQGDSATNNEKEGIRVFVLFPSTTLQQLHVQSSNRKNYHYP